jgi:preprotein translocase subunit SecD
VAPPTRSGSRSGRVLAVLAAVIVIMLISVLGKETFDPARWHQQFKVGLGLDLSSGTEVVLKAETNGQVPSAGVMQQAVSVLLDRVNGTGNSGAQVQQEGTDLINISVPGKPPQDVINLVSTTAQMAFRPVYLVSATPGTATPAKSSAKASSSPSPTPSSSPTPTPSTTASAKASSSATPKSSTAALSARLASSPSPTASSSAKASSTPKASTTPKATATPTPTPTSTSSTGSTTYYGDPSEVNAATMKLFDKEVCVPGPNANTVNTSWQQTVGYSLAKDQWNDLNSQIVSCDPSGIKYVLGPAVFVGKDITSVTASLETNSTQWVVPISLNGGATSSFGTLTTKQYNSYYTGAQSGDPDDTALDETAVVLDGNVVEAPETQGALTSGSFQIQGGGTDGFDQAQATQLANLLKYGSLPLDFQQQTVESISAQLGRDSLNAGLIAGVIGLLLVVIYLFIYYRGLGLVSVSSLLIAASLAYLSVVLLSRYQNYTLELSGIAGLIVAIGITADSFIVFFERLRDEVRDGKSLRPAVEAGWKRARRTILVSDTVSFLAAVLLYHFAVSDVQGFAYTLGLTTIIDVLVVFLFTKPMVTLLAGTKFYGGGHRWSGLDPARLGAKNPWRGSGRRTVRTQRTTSGVRSSASSSTTTREA